MAELTDLPEEDYFTNPRLSQSQAKTLLANPARYKYELTAPREERATFDVGHAAHTLILGTGAPLAVIDVDTAHGRPGEGGRRVRVRSGSARRDRAEQESRDADREEGPE